MKNERGKPFAPGNRIGRGRPKGSPNKAKPPDNPGTALLEESREALIRKCIAMAKQGDLAAMRICLDQVSPARRRQCVSIDLPRKMRTAEDVNQAADRVTQAIRRGNITPAEGYTMMKVLESRSRVMANVDLEKRLEKLEKVIDDNAKKPFAA